MEKKLPGKIIYSYGFANLTGAMLLAFVTAYYSIFLTDVVMVSTAHMKLMQLISGIVILFFNIIMVFIIQRSQLRWGKYRSWFLFIPVITCLFFILLFANLPMSTGMKMVWLIITYIINRLSINSLSIAHLSFISVSKNTQERLWLSARNIQFGIAATIIIAAIIPVVIHFYTVNFASLLFYTALILAMLQLLGYWNLFYQSGDYEKYDPDIIKPSNKMSIEDLFTQLFGNSQLLILMVTDMIVIVGSLAVTMLAPYYFKHVTGDKDWVLYFSPAFLITGLLSALIAPYIILKFGKKKVYLFSLSWGVLCFIFLRIFGDSGPYTFTGIICAGGILSGFIAPMRQAMYMDVSEFGFNKTGKDVTAYIMSLHKMSLGIGGALAMAVVPFGLKILGFIPDMPVTDQFINGLMNMICFIPIVCGVIAVSLMSFYSLTDDKVVKIMEAHSK